MKKIVILLVLFCQSSVFAQKSVPSEKFNTLVLKKIIQRSAESGSEDLIVVKNGKVLSQKYTKGSGNEIKSVQSITKTIVALTYMLLLKEGRVDTLDKPLLDFYPSLAFDQRRSLTVRSVLTHSTGIVDPENLWDNPNLLSTALNVQPEYPIFSQFIYSNAASLLMGGVLDKLIPPSAQPGVDPIIYFLNSRIFNQIGVTNLQWVRDAQGNLHTSGGVYLSSNSLLKLGLLFLQNGQWKGKTIVESDFLSVISNPGVGITQCYALMTWIVDPTCGQFAGSVAVSEPNLVKKKGYYFDGFGGQYVVIIPESGIVAVRMKTPLKSGSTIEELEKASFSDFPDLVSKL